MTVSPEVEAQIRRLFFAEHWKQGTIATQLGVHPDVVKRVVGPIGPTPGTKRTRAILLDPYKPFIAQTLETYPRLLSTRLFEMVKERGYTGSINTLRRFVRTARPRSRKAYLDLEVLPGEVGEVDWGHVGELRVPGGFRPLWVFVMLLAYSRAMFAELVLSLDAPSLWRSLLRASMYFGGSPRAWLFDNAKTVVVERRGNLVRFHERLVELSGHLHVELRVCDPGAPHQKGGVERAMRYLKGSFFAARHMHSIEQGNQQLRSFIEETAAARPHPRFAGRTVADAFAEEQARLLPLPDALPPLELLTPTAVDAKAFVQLDTNRYSVPSKYASSSLSLVTTDTTVRLLDGEKEVARHSRSWGRKQILERPEHRAELLQEKKAARDLKGRDRLAIEVPDIQALFERWFEHEFNLGSMVVRTGKLLDSYGAAVLRAAVSDMLDKNLVDFGALSVLCETHRKARGSQVVPPLQLADHVVDRDVVPHDLGGYDE